MDFWKAHCIREKVFRISAVILSQRITSPSSINVIFALDRVFSERNGFEDMHFKCCSNVKFATLGFDTIGGNFV